MTYFQTSTQTEFERRVEADRILALLRKDGEWVMMKLREMEFVTQVAKGPVSAKQLFWLRDLADKYL